MRSSMLAMITAAVLTASVTAFGGEPGRAGQPDRFAPPSSPRSPQRRSLAEVLNAYLQPSDRRIAADQANNPREELPRPAARGAFERRAPDIRLESPRGRVPDGPQLGNPQLGNLAVVPSHRPGEFVFHEVTLYGRVKVEDHHEIAPHAIPQVVAIRDPAACRHNCRCCGSRVVYVAIYVPPCACERVKVKKHGRELEFDYGKYEVDVEVEDGCIEINYDD